MPGRYAGILSAKADKKKKKKKILVSLQVRIRDSLCFCANLRAHFHSADQSEHQLLLLYAHHPLGFQRIITDTKPEKEKNKDTGKEVEARLTASYAGYLCPATFWLFLSWL